MTQIKTAARLLREFGSLTNLLNQIPYVSRPGEREKLKSFASNVRRSYELVCLRHDVPLPVPVRDLLFPSDGSWEALDNPESEFRDFLETNSFRSILVQLNRSAREMAPSPESPTAASKPKRRSGAKLGRPRSVPSAAVAIVDGDDKDEKLMPGILMPIYAPSDPAKCLDGVTIVRNRADAERVVRILNSLPSSTFHAVDTEVADLDIKAQNVAARAGRITCASVYSGPDVDFGNGPKVSCWKA